MSCASSSSTSAFSAVRKGAMSKCWSTESSSFLVVSDHLCRASSTSGESRRTSTFEDWPLGKGKGRGQSWCWISQPENVTAMVALARAVPNLPAR